ncbi:MAG: hypothetical protein HS104_11800 [Polyangiaceae bacterium]|nr:hypothetical protein [Polyangiaceae bacterium]MCL4748537.1 hypothetical protein [Myxococcales bacterium]
MLRVLLFPDTGAWVAQALELDVCAQGVTEEQAIENLDATIHIHEALDSESGAEPLADVKRVPPAIFERLYQAALPWDRGKPGLVVRRTPLEQASVA